MFIDIKSDNYNIHFEFERRITVIKGDSGIGKTTLVELLQDESYDVQKETTLPVVVATTTTWQAVVRGSKSSIIIFDDMDCTETAEFSTLYKECAINNDLYFIIIGRADTEMPAMARLSYSVNSIFTIESVDNQYRQIPYYQLPEYSGECDDVLVEDTASGYTFFQKLFDGFANVYCAESGKSSVVNDTLQLKPCKTLVIFDSAAFGCHIDEFYNKVVRKRDIVVLNDYECFEELIIRTNMFIQNSNVQLELEKMPDSANGFLSWENYFEELLRKTTISKQYRFSHGAKLPHCYFEVCAKCNEYILAKCDYNDKNCSDKFVSLLKGTKYDILVSHRRHTVYSREINSFN